MKRAAVFNKIFISVLAASPLAPLLIAAIHDFIPDFVFDASSFSALRALGMAEWTASQCEISARPRDSSGGRLVLGKSYQDSQLHFDFIAPPAVTRAFFCVPSERPKAD
jgi:hypothetical protein